MNRKWNLFICAAVLGGAILVAYGAPIVPVVAGVGVAALVKLLRPQTN